MGFRRAFGILLTGAGSILVVASIGYRYAAWPGGAVTNALGYWFSITLTESWAWVAMFVTGLCIVIADHEDGSHTPADGAGRGGVELTLVVHDDPPHKGGPIG